MQRGWEPGREGCEHGEGDTCIAGMHTRGGRCTRRGDARIEEDEHTEGRCTYTEGMHTLLEEGESTYWRGGCTRKWDADVREMHTAERCTCKEDAHASGMQLPEGCTCKEDAHTHTGTLDAHAHIVHTLDTRTHTLDTRTHIGCTHAGRMQLPAGERGCSCWSSSEIGGRNFWAALVPPRAGEGTSWRVSGHQGPWGTGQCALLGP